mgnify:CR=1 FL=1
MTEAQTTFLRALAGGGWATYVNETTWELPDGSRLSISRAEVEELERLDYVGNYSRFNPHVIMNDWWSSKLTDAGRTYIGSLGQSSRDGKKNGNG